MIKHSSMFVARICIFLLLGQSVLDRGLLSYPQQHAARAKSFFPLQIGNKWVMELELTPGYEYIQAHEVLDNTRIKGRLYFIVNMISKRYFREDTSGYFYEFDEYDSCETLLMDFGMIAGDSLKLHCLYGRDGFTVLQDRKTVTTFTGEIGEQLNYEFDYAPDVVDDEKWVHLQEGVGPVVYYPYYDSPSYLKGAIIDGRVYGDTSLVSVAERGPILPRSFYLQQNYPNPFYNSTQIDFEIKYAGQFKLEIVNLAGQVVRVLRSGILPSGTYVAEWEGKDDRGNLLPSGVYFYRLISESVVQQKKMILLR